MQQYRDTQCFGDRSCFDSTFNRASTSYSGDEIYLSAFEAGAFSTLNIHQTTDIYVRGSLALYRATVNMYATTFLYTGAAFSLNGADLYCDSGVTCYIYCQSDGCFNISSATGSGTYTVDCQYNLNANILCPDDSDLDEVQYHLSNIDIENDLPSVLINQMLLHSNKDNGMFDYGDTMCSSDKNNALQTNCGDASECSNVGTQSYLNKALCCSSLYGCYNPCVSTTISSFRYERVYIVDINICLPLLRFCV